MKPKHKSLLKLIGVMLLLPPGILFGLLLFLRPAKGPEPKLRPGAWQRVSRGMKSHEVLHVLGEPRGSANRDQTDGEWLEPWAPYRVYWDFCFQEPGVTCYFDEADRVIHIDAHAFAEHAQARAGPRYELVEGDGLLDRFWSLLGY